MTFTKEQRSKAKEMKRHLIGIVMEGRYAKAMSIEFTAIAPKWAVEKLEKLYLELVKEMKERKDEPEDTP